MSTSEGFSTGPIDSNDQLAEAFEELSSEQEDALNELFPEGPKTDEDRLIYTRVLMEMATNPETVDVKKIAEDVLREREEILSTGGFGEIDYSVDKSGIVTKGDQLEHFKENQ